MYRVTPCLSVGPYPHGDRVAALLAANVTHVLNVSNSQSDTAALAADFREVIGVPMLVDGRLPEADVLHAIDQLFRMTAEPMAARVRPLRLRPAAVADRAVAVPRRLRRGPGGGPPHDRNPHPECHRRPPALVGPEIVTVCGGTGARTGFTG